MSRIRDLLRLKYAQGLRERAIALSLGLGKETVGCHLARARQAGLLRPLPAHTDDSLELLRFPGPKMASRLDRPVPDWAGVDVELRRPGVTRALLWDEYRARAPDGFGYAWFCAHFDAWKGRARPTSHLWCAFSATRQTHVGEEKVFVDFAGDTIDVIDPVTGEARALKQVVAAMGASNYTYAEAVASEPTGPNSPQEACEKPLPAPQASTCRPKPDSMLVKPAYHPVESLPAIPWNKCPRSRGIDAHLSWNAHQGSARRVNQSSTAARQMKPRAIGI